MAGKKTAFTVDQSVFARVKIGGAVTLIPATVKGVNEPADDAPNGTRTTFDITPDGGTGTANVQEHVLLPRD